VSYLGGQGGALGAVIAIGGLVTLFLIVAAIVVSLAFTLATRAVVLEQLGAMAALRRGFQLLRARLGRALLVWLIQLGLGLAAGLALFVVLIPVIVVAAGLVGVAAYTGGAGAAVAVAVPVAVVAFVVLLVAAGLIGAYFSTYWTLAFRRLELEAPRPVAWPPAAYPPQQPAG